MKILSTQQLNGAALIKTLRPAKKTIDEITPAAQEIIAAVRKGGDRALFELTKKFDGVNLQSFTVSEKEMEEAYRLVDRKLLKALKRSKRNIAKVAKAQLPRKEKSVVTAPGIKVWREFRPIERVGLYVPGGQAAYPSTVLMLGVPAKIAGCKEIILCAPPGADGACNAAVLAAADLCGIKKIYKLGGAQAIAAMAYGTETIAPVYKIFGPGNRYVTAAKMLVGGRVAIDMPAGPSEVLIIADESGPPAWIAADIIAQLEHSQSAQAVLLTPAKRLAGAVAQALKQQLPKTARKAIIQTALKNSFIVLVKSLDEACVLANAYAPEHIEVMTVNDRQVIKNLTNAGSVFLGQYGSAPLGDYATGSNHTLPTGGSAKMFSPLSVTSFGKMMYVQQINKRGMQNIQNITGILATGEGLSAHKDAITIRNL